MGDSPPHAGTFATLVSGTSTCAFILYGEGEGVGDGTSSTGYGHRAGDLHRLHPARQGSGPPGWPSAPLLIRGAIPAGTLPGDRTCTLLEAL
jgi:hypothetical protein